MPRKKPAPDIYRYVLEKMRLDARHCLAFEDSGNGLRASLGAGLKTVITRNGYTRDDDFTGAALVLDSLGDTEHPSQVLRRQYGRDCLCVTTLLQLLN